MDNELIKWGCRILLILFVILIIWLLLRSQKIDTQPLFDQIQYYQEPLIGVVESQIPFYQHGKEFIKKFNERPQKAAPRVNKTEEMCRKIIEKIYNRKFPSERPDFLKSPMTKKNLELDCYNRDLKIALEYNGQQHYNYTPHFHRSKKAFYAQVHRDDWKRKKCAEHGICLIEVPYWVIPINLEEYITNELRKKGRL